MVLGNPIDWSARYSALYAWASGVSGWSTRWADQPEARPNYPYVLLDVVNTAREGGADEIRRELDLTRARDIRVTPVVQNNALYRITINGTNYDYTSDADATALEITAGLEAIVNLGTEPVAATDNAGTLDIVGDDEALNPGTPQLFTVETSSNLTWANLDAGNEVAIIACGQRVVTLNVQAFERNTDSVNAAIDPSRNAYNMLTRLQASLMVPTVQAQLRAASIAVIAEGPIIDLSEPVEDTILSRASMDVRLRTVSEMTEYVGYIESVSGTATYTGTRNDPVTDTLSAP